MVSSCWQPSVPVPPGAHPAPPCRGFLCACALHIHSSVMMHRESFARGICFSFHLFNKRILCSFLSLEQHNQTPGNIAIDKQSEVYKMLQENQELNEPPKQSASFLVLQEILESEEKGEYLLHTWSECALPLCWVMFKTLFSLGWVTFKTLFSVYLSVVQGSMCRWLLQKPTDPVTNLIPSYSLTDQFQCLWTHIIA